MVKPANLVPQKYEVLKTRTGAEIVGMTRETTEGIEITLPMICHLQVVPGTNKTQCLFYPYSPLSQEEKIVIPREHIAHKSKMNEQFIPFYDNASSTWMKMIETKTIPLTEFKNRYSESDMRKVIEELAEKYGLEDTYIDGDEYDQLVEEWEEFEFAEVPKDPKKIH